VRNLSSFDRSPVFSASFCSAEACLTNSGTNS